VTSDPASLAGRRAVVTGAASGIGAAVAARLLADGADVLGVDLDADRLGWLAGAGGTGLVADLAGPEGRALVADAGAGADLLVNAAGILFARPLLEVELAEWHRIWQVNVDSMFFLTQALARTMPDGGAIVNLSSSAAKISTSVELGPYALTKGAAIGITRLFATELAPRRIRVNAVCPGVIDTPMQARVVAGVAAVRGTAPGALLAERVRRVPLGRAGRPEEVAELVRFLLSDAAGYMTGQAINITGGAVTW
jgi:meso-butanediol dehydrogenase/(S,S)-butanediol dehydrogenase/diacetyl reductase